MPLPTASALAAAMMAQTNTPDTDENRPFFEGLASAVLTAMQAATVTVNVTGTIVGASPTGPVTGTCVATGLGVVT